MFQKDFADKNNGRRAVTNRQWGVNVMILTVFLPEKIGVKIGVIDSKRL
jgi:hypothetical protein